MITTLIVCAAAIAVGLVIASFAALILLGVLAFIADLVSDERASARIAAATNEATTNPPGRT